MQMWQGRAQSLCGRGTAADCGMQRDEHSMRLVQARFTPLAIEAHCIGLHPRRGNVRSTQERPAIAKPHLACRCAEGLASARKHTAHASAERPIENGFHCFSAPT